MQKLDEQQRAAEKVGARVKQLREYRGIFQETFAEQCGTSQQYISAIENGTKVPSIKQLLRIADVLDCEFEVVFKPKELT